MKFACFFIALVVFVACKGEPVAQVLDSRSDNPEVVQFNGLFQKLIGREVGISDKNDIAGYTKADLNKQEYAAQVANILQSKQFYEEGFWHFHKDRLLLGRETTSQDEGIDHAALRREMVDIARADNYWDILTYRDRWLSLRRLGLLYECEDYLNTEGDANARNKCAYFLQAVMHPEVEHEEICVRYQEEDEGIPTLKEKARKFTDIYRDRCCASAGVASQDTGMCNKINNSYTNLFSEDFCAVAAKPVIDNYCDVNNDSSGMVKNVPPLSSGEGGGDDDSKEQNYPTPPFTWKDSKFKDALALYISLHLAEDTDLFIDVSVPQGNIYHSDDQAWENFIKVTFPENLQGIHASPYWLSTHYTSDSNQHLHRARIIYHSWFCERITPNQAKNEGGGPSKAEKERFEDYFPIGDAHKNSSKNCFDCHTMIQPLANYFGRMSVGVRYENDRSLTMNAARFLQGESEEDDKKLPLRAGIGTGYFNIHKDDFFKSGHNVPGMVGLGKLLSNLPKVKRCVVKYTWNKIFGCENELSQKEISDAVPQLTSYRSLLTHLLMTEKAKAYFIPEEGNTQWNGQRVLREMVAAEREAARLSCNEAETQAVANNISGENIVTSKCATCHSNDERFITTEDDGTEIIFKDDEFLKTVYLRSNNTELGPMMPQGGYSEVAGINNSRAVQRQVFKCYIEEQAKSRGIELPELKDTSCAEIDHKKNHEIME